jgi:hypothetical protein
VAVTRNRTGPEARRQGPLCVRAFLHRWTYQPIKQRAKPPVTSTEPFTVEPRPIVEVRNKAVKVAKIFDVLAIVTIIVGGLSAALLIVAALTAVDGNNADALQLALGVALWTTIAWASISLFSIVAGFIAQEAKAR